MWVAKESKARSGAVRSRTFQFSVLGLFLLVTACGLFFGFARLVGSFPLLMAALSIGLTLGMVLVALGMAKIVQLHYYPKPWCKYLELGYVFVPLGMALLQLVVAPPPLFDVLELLSLLVTGCVFFFITAMLFNSWKKRWAGIAEKAMAQSPLKENT